MDILFKTPNGHMQIYCDSMFPCDERRFKKIVNLMLWDYESRDDNIKNLRQFFEDGIKKTIQWYLDNREWWETIISGEYQNYYEKMYSNR